MDQGTSYFKQPKKNKFMISGNSLLFEIIYGIIADAPPYYFKHS